MQASPEKLMIFTQIPKIMGEVGAIEKTRRNSQGSGYMFRGIDDVYAALQGVLSKHEVCYSPNVMEQIREERQSKAGGNLIYTVLRVKYTFYAKDGSSFDATVVGEAMDSGDKGSNKAMSAALKYALLQVFCIPTEGDNDTENQTHQVTARPGAEARNAPVASAPARTAPTAAAPAGARRPIGPPPAAGARTATPPPATANRGPTAPKTASPSKKSEPAQENFADFQGGPINN